MRATKQNGKLLEQLLTGGRETGIRQSRNLPYGDLQRKMETNKERGKYMDT